MIERSRPAIRPLSAWDVLLPLQRAWWVLLGVPLAGMLHWLVLGLAAFPVTLAVGPYGLGVVGLTVVVRFVLLPLSVWQLHAAMKARERTAELHARIEPELARLRRRYRRRPQRLREETARLMRAHGGASVAALGGLVGTLLPSLIQAPVLIALYWVISGFAHSPVAGTDLHFLWIPSIAHPDLFLLPALVGLATWGANLLIQRVTPRPVNDEAARAQRQVSFIYPLVIAVMAHFAPAALALYWLTGSLVGAGQQALASRVLAARAGAG
jgi:YidC/Oxa1 family membrane protein insertase